MKGKEIEANQIHEENKGKQNNSDETEHKRTQYTQIKGTQTRP